MPSKFCIHYVSKSGRPSSGHRIEKSQASSQFSRIVQTKECSNHQTIALISQASKVMLKILHARLQHYVNQEPPDVQAGFRKGRGTRDRIANICWSIAEKAMAPTSVLLPGKPHGRRSLVGYSPWDCRESDTTEWLHLLAWEMSATVPCSAHSLDPSWELGWGLTFSSLVATAGSSFGDIMNAKLWWHHPLGIWIFLLEFHRIH